MVREYVYAHVAASHAAGQMSSMILPWVDVRLMSLSLAHTAAQFRGEHCVMLLDGAGWHKANELTVPANMRLLALPPSSEAEPRRTRLGYIRENDNRLPQKISGLLEEQPTAYSSALPEDTYTFPFIA